MRRSRVLVPSLLTPVLAGRAHRLDADPTAATTDGPTVGDDAEVTDLRGGVFPATRPAPRDLHCDPTRYGGSSRSLLRPITVASDTSQRGALAFRVTGGNRPITLRLGPTAARRGWRGRRNLGVFSKMAIAEPLRLTSLSHGAGCACKLGPSQLHEVLELLGPSVPTDDVIVSEASGDDAAVYRLADGTGAIVTLDFFTPLVDDPFDWGRIAAANALSDVYAMGGMPALALNVAGWPVDVLPLETLADVLRGGRAIADEAGVPVVGGHTITTEKEPLYGMVALGFAYLDALIRNTGARPGMSLVLTKPIGVGMLTTAGKRGVATDAQLADAIATMTTLNDRASRAAVAAGITAGTDVTGFGLLGHLRRLLEASGCAATVDASAVPLLDGALELAQRDVVAGGTKRNHAWLQATTDWGACTPPEQLLLADAQTSGGLLLATDDPEALTGDLDAWVIGATTDGTAGAIEVTGRLAGA